jgi:hypothetical protein
VLLADVAPELAERNLPVWVILTLAATIAALFTALMLQVSKTSAIQDQRIADRDRFQAELSELAKSTGAIVSKNTEGLFVFAKQLEASSTPRRKPGPPAQGGTG